MKNYSVQKCVTLAVVLVLNTNIITSVVGAQNEKASPAGTSCLGGASLDYKAHKEYVVVELANVTPTIEGYQYSTTFPQEGSEDVIYGYAGCARDLDASECSSCLGDAKDSLMDGDCAFALSGNVQSFDCTMYYVPGKTV